MLAAICVRVRLHAAFAFLATGTLLSGAALPEKAGGPIEVGRLPAGARVLAVRAADGSWGVRVKAAGASSIARPRLIEVRLHDGQGAPVRTLASGYRTVERTAAGFAGRGEVSAEPGVTFHVEDRWTVSGPVLHVARRLRVAGNSPAAFVSALMLSTEKEFTWPDLEYFVPGLTYGAYRAGRLEIREDAMPAPLMGIYFGDGTSVAVLNPSPRGNTIAADGRQRQGPLVDERLGFGGFGGRESPAGGVEFGYWYPGTDGYVREQTSGRRALRRRYHPVRDGFVQEYALAFHFGREERFHEFYRNAWRWSWATLKPTVTYQDIELVRRSLIDMLADRLVTTSDGRAGFPWAYESLTGAVRPNARSALMGFVAKNLEAAVFMLREADRDRTERGRKLRQIGLRVIDSFTRMKMAPPEGEGFDLETGRPTVLMGRENRVYLRAITDDMKLLMRGYQREKAQGRDHPEWVRWCKEFADWLLTQQGADGSFPRAWEPGTGKVNFAAPQSSYNAVPLLVLLSQSTGDRKYLDAAIQAADFCWTSEQARDEFIGGVIDGPNIRDKESATLSAEAYLALYEATRQDRWLRRAQAAAENAETYVYIWQVPMPDDEDSAALEWDKGVSTVGLNLIAAGTSGSADMYMAFDVDEYAKLYKYTGDEHFLEVARILLHNTKNMLPIPGRTFDHFGPGFQQEAWGMSGRRGYSVHRLWLPWISTSHLNGILFTEEFDPALFREMCGKGATPKE